MSILDYIILGIIAVWFILAAVYIVRQKKRGKSCCGGGCGSSCNCKCSGCKSNKNHSKNNT